MLKVSDIEATTQARDKTLTNEGENLIDRALETQWQPGEEVSLTMPGKFESRVVNHLAEMYRVQGGWDVSVSKSTYRETDGCFILTFRKATDATSYYQK